MQCATRLPRPASGEDPRLAPVQLRKASRRRREARETCARFARRRVAHARPATPRPPNVSEFVRKKRSAVGQRTAQTRSELPTDMAGGTVPQTTDGARLK